MLIDNCKKPTQSPTAKHSREPVFWRNVYMALASLLYAAFSISYMSSFHALPTSLAAIIFYTYPLLVVVIGPLSDLKSTELYPTRATVILHVVAFAGLVVVLIGQTRAGSSEDEPAASHLPPTNSSAPSMTRTPTVPVTVHGVVLACIASATFAGYCLCASRAAKCSTAMPPLLTAAITNAGQVAVVGGVLALVHAIDPTTTTTISSSSASSPTESPTSSGSGEQPSALSWRLPSADDDGGDAIAHLVGAVASYVFAQGALFGAFAMASCASAVTLFLNTEPIVSVVLGVCLLGEPFTPAQWLGLLIAVAALSLSSAISMPGRGAPLGETGQSLHVRWCACACARSRVEPPAGRADPQ